MASLYKRSFVTCNISSYYNERKNVCVYVCLRVFFVYKRLLNRYVSNDYIFSECSVTFRQPNEDVVLGITQRFACYRG